ncbi:hypothetical protein KP003_17185 [Geomonas nitrogeniifigens]|uniref:hypothetical protein n=1 Tax=Geomonas diazotrophica TaxID=2843197 RepID=UPI001C2BB88F|nr:hypothetical protein [Geomonas nitrogeniifigens]QXE86075.1 hypothetical protein KP003_17185 [Geomonas nitrogeniifigens]
MNWQIIKSNISEARQELERIEKEIDSADPPEEPELFLMLEHAYHHLNFAWNIRNIPTERYASMSDEDFDHWGKFPKGFDALELVAETEE